MPSFTSRDLPRLAAGIRRRSARLVRKGRSVLAGFGASSVETPESSPLFVHFGTHKTGSSSIQETLYANSGRVFGYDYPDLGAANGSLTFNQAFCDVKSLQARRLIDDEAMLEKRRSLLIERLTTLLSTAPRQVPKVLSAEAIAQFTPSELQRMDKFLAGFWDNRIYIGYVREPVSYMRSAFQETIKLSGAWLDCFDPEASDRLLQVRSHKLIQDLDALAGKDRVRIFAFERDTFPDHDVVRHFLAQIGVDSEKMEIRHSNESLSLLAVKLLYIYRARKTANDRDIQHPQSLNAFVASLSDLGAEQFDLHPELAARIESANRSFYEWAETRLDRPLLRPGANADTGIRGSSDLEHLSQDELALFSDRLKEFGVSLPASPDLDAVASAMYDLRLRFASMAQKPLFGIPKLGASAATMYRRSAPVADLRATGESSIAKPLLFLHIGMGKTGTTSIQQFCWSNRSLLEKRGLTYPKLGVEAGAHHRLSPHIPPFLAKTWDFIPPEDWVPELAAEARQPILLSSELISSADRATALRAAAVLRRHFDVRIILYLRRIDDSIMATFNQNVKAGTQRLSIEDALPGMFERLRADRILAIWTEAFGGENVILRPYDRGQFADGDILRDLCATVGLAWSEDYVVPEGNPNARLGRSALEFKRCINMAIPDTAISSKFNQGLLDYSAAQSAGAAEIFHDSDLLPGAVRRVLIARQEELYRDLAKEWPGLRGDTLFTARLPADDLTWTPLGLSPEAFAEVGQAVLTPALKTVLRVQIDAARRADDPQRLLYASRFAPLL